MEKSSCQSTLDHSQLPVVEADKGYHLVLASPGCGKTHILAERVRYAHQKGVAFEDMLCLTFTNRAAREMLSRIHSILDVPNIETLQVGNVHHFCSKFLFETNKVEADTSIIDDEEAVSIIADYRNENEEGIIGNYHRYKIYQEIIFFSHLIYQIEKGHPYHYFLHPECMTDNDREAAKIICKQHNLDFSPQTIPYIYRNVQLFIDDSALIEYHYSSREKVDHLLWKMYYAGCYEQYKTKHHMLDFEDLLLLTYDAYQIDPDCKKYTWIQVDEVQDLNAMQLAIIDLLTAEKDATVVYLGDEQQAIFSFMGAKLEVLTTLKSRCKGNIHHLLKNHRSPKYLLDVFNDYAANQLNIDRELLPITDNQTKAAPNDLLIMPSSDVNKEIADIIHRAEQYDKENSQATTAIIVNSNADADKISTVMAKQDLSHFKVSGRDMFDTPQVKMLMAHLNILHNEHHFLSWTRLLKGLKVFDTNALARRFVHKLKQIAISPTDFLLYDNTTYITQFLQTYHNEDIVVFDTETTGLNIYEDDIIEISAVRIRQGKIVGQPFDIYIQTNRPIMEKLGDIDNPLHTLYQQKAQQGELLSAQEGLQAFLDYIGESTLLGHNAMFDYNILDHNLRRNLHTSICDRPNKVFDSLKLIRLLERNLSSYKLASLLEKFQLAGENSHRAIDDVLATVQLVHLCALKAQDIVDQQREFIAHPQVQKCIQKLRSAYQPLFLDHHAKRYLQSNKSEKPLVQFLKEAYEYLIAAEYLKEIARFEYILRYLDMDMLTEDNIPNAFNEQINHYFMELNTMKESDFCNSKSIQERIYLTTIHKAKGLEFDNVIIFDAINGRYPSGFNKLKKHDEEDARKFYVAMSRAKRRLVVAYALASQDRYGNVHTCEITPFIQSIAHHFQSTTDASPQSID